MPVRKGGYWYYARTVEGQQYADPLPAGGRRRARSTRPPLRTAAPLPGEEVLLDGNVEAGDSEFFALGTFDVSPDGDLLAYSVDLAGDERFTLRVKDLRTGEVLPDEVPQRLLRLGVVGGRVDAVLPHGRRRVAAAPGVAARRRHRPGRGRRGRTRSPTSGSGSASG